MLPVAVVVVDPDDRVADANMLAEELLNRSARSMRGRPITALMPPATGEVVIESAHGARVPVARREAAVPGHAGWRAVTLQPLPRAPGSERSGGALSAVGAAAMLAHEIRNPLSGIRGAAQLIAAEPAGSDELTGLIVREVDRIAALIDRMQAFGDERPLPIAAANIYPLLDHARRLTLAAWDVAIDERFDPSLPLAAVNGDALVQVLINLLRNACQAVAGQPDRRVTIATAYRHGVTGRPQAGGAAVALPIEIAVIDNGPGPPADIADHLFDPFVSGRPDGQGLGLALVDKLVRDMGGTVRHDREGSPPTTVFRLALPRGAA